jgi:hypothetical protein
MRFLVVYCTYTAAVGDACVAAGLCCVFSECFSRSVFIFSLLWLLYQKSDFFVVEDWLSYTWVHVQLVPRLWMSGAVPLFLLHAFMPWDRVNSTFTKTVAQWVQRICCGVYDRGIGVPFPIRARRSLGLSSHTGRRVHQHHIQWIPGLLWT